MFWDAKKMEEDRKKEQQRQIQVKKDRARKDAVAKKQAAVLKQQKDKQKQEDFDASLEQLKKLQEKDKQPAKLQRLSSPFGGFSGQNYKADQKRTGPVFGPQAPSFDKNKKGPIPDKDAAQDLASGIGGGGSSKLPRPF